MPTTPASCPGNSLYCWRSILQMMLRHKARLLSGNLIAISATLLAVPIPLLIPMLVDEVLLHRPGALLHYCDLLLPQAWRLPAGYILLTLLLTLLLRAANLLLGVWHTREFSRISKEITFHIRRDLLLRLQAVSMREYEGLGSSTVASHLVTDIDTLDDFIGIAVGKFLVAVLSIVGTAAVLIWMHWQLALLILLFNPLVIYITLRFGRKVKRLKAEQNKAYQGFQESLAETLDAVQELRASHREGHFIQRIIEGADQIRRRSTAYAWKSDAATRLSFTVFLAGFDLFRAASMLLVLFSDLTIGEMLAFYAYLWFMMGPVQEVLGVHYALYGANAALARLNGLLQLAPEPHYPALHDPFCHASTVAVELRQLSFAYQPGRPVLQRVCCQIRAGERVAIVGASGAGKSTLTQLLLGLYQPDEGEILYGGVPLREIGYDQVRRHVAVVLQHPALFNDSVRNNLALGRALEEPRLWQALEIAQLDKFVRGLPDGLDTRIGRSGIRFSGGQRQRLAVARMVLSEPKVVILDEATSALDATLEGHLHRSLEGFLKQRTAIIIAHRLSAVRQAERILVFHQGGIAEEGTHEALIQQGGVYAELYADQI